MDVYPGAWGGVGEMTTWFVENKHQGLPETKRFTHEKYSLIFKIDAKNSHI